MQLLARSSEELKQGLFELMVDGDAGAIRVSWKRVDLVVREEPLAWSAAAALHFTSGASTKS
jgi:hypothetical protein